MERIEAAFAHMKRRFFLPADKQQYADIDAPIQIGHEQTNSQPSTVRMMLEWLDAQPGNKVLDVGSGSGWTTALLAHLVGEDGRVYAVERIPELLRFGEQNCRQLGLTTVSFHFADETLGLPEHQPYDRILVSAAATTLPSGLVAQLKSDGRMVIPVGHSVHVIAKDADGLLLDHEVPGFAFVPLV